MPQNALYVSPLLLKPPTTFLKNDQWKLLYIIFFRFNDALNGAKYKEATYKTWTQNQRISEMASS